MIIINVVVIITVMFVIMGGNGADVSSLVFLLVRTTGATVTGNVQDLNNGAYNVGFTLTRSGTYNITINANGVPIGKDTKYSMVVPNGSSSSHSPFHHPRRFG
jgi:hypothetical protein